MIIAPEELSKLRESMEGESLALRTGCFDLIHEGHHEALRFSSEQADKLVVGVASDQRVSSRKGAGRPIRDQQARIETVDAMKEVDYTFVLPSDVLSYAKLVIKLRPDVYVELVEYKYKKALVRPLMNLIGVECVIDYGPKLNSTTAIIEKMPAGIEIPNEGLGLSDETAS